MIGVEDPSSPLPNATDAPSEPISTTYAFPTWQPPELGVSPSDRQSFGSRGSVDEELSGALQSSPEDPAASRVTSVCQRWLASCLLWISSFLKAETEKQTPGPALGSSRFVVHPHSALYIRWYILIVTVALLVAIFDPYNAAFVDTAGMYPFYNFWAVSDYVATTFLTADIVLNFFLAYKDEKNKCIITDNRAIAWRYFTSKFWFDLVVSIPVEPIVAGGLGYTVRDTQTAKFVGLLRWLRVGRMYPIFGVFATIQHKQILPPVFLTLARNYTYLFYIVHWMACVIYFIGRAGNYGEDTWVFYKNNPAEAIVLCLYFAINVVAQAYILGTITVLLVKKDVESGEYRNAVINLDKYLSDKELPKSLQAAMREHLELQSYSEKTADENILKHHPSTIKQKVLWHLYQDVLKDCYLLAGCTPQFLNLLLSVARMELFMPNVTITQQGDTAADLLIIADGIVSVAPPSSAATDPHGSVPSMGGPSMGTFDASEHGSMSLDVSTALPPMESVLAQPRSVKQRDSAMSYNSTLANTISVKQRDSAMSASSFRMTRFRGGGLMAGGNANGADSSIIIVDGGTQVKGEDSLEKKNEGIMWNLLKGIDSSNGREDSAHGGDGSLHGGSSFGSASSMQQSFIHGPRGRATMLGTSDPLGEVPFFAEGVYTSAARTCSVTRVLIISYTDFQRLAESNPKDVSRIFKNLVKRTEKRLKEVAKQAMDAGQLGPAHAHTLMHIAEGESFEAVPSIQLAGIKRSLTPAQLIIMEHLGEARRFSKEDAKKHQNLRMTACLNAAVSGNTQRLQALLGRGRDVSATDYDNRSALMLACRNNQEEVVEMLLKAGADTSTVDSLGYTALFEAVRKGNDGCISLMLKYNAKLGVESRISGPFIFQAIISKDLECLRRLIRVGADLDCSDLDGRTPLFLAASEGLLEVVILLVKEGNVAVDTVDSWGHTPEGDARLAGHHEVAQYLQFQRDGKQPLLAKEGSLCAQQAEEPSSLAIKEPPHRQSGELGHAPRSSHSYSQLIFQTGSKHFLPSSNRSSIDQKRQELRKSMRNRTVSVNGIGRSRLAPSNSGARRRPTSPIAFEEQLPSTFPANLSGSSSPRPMTPTAFEEQSPSISPTSHTGPTDSPSFHLRSTSQLIGDPNFEEHDAHRPPGTSPAGWIAFDGANSPGSGPGAEQAHPLPKVGSFLAETTGDNNGGDSMVQPFVDPESQVQRTANSTLSVASVVSSQEK
eukprot:CAMPEP_0202345276 /NCGR_PEP_ID=MMETSP1126-20121109/4595_1 /ASSEMBLY_ACC=CAM_ASM_000457 /TAXON_ID=3047 /ORGANISM="Dunaliella tertiolecta, Strain CCMP1320" /LENGTH=1226 /DNA_ID=CAMNT_0048936579 /DNA_START=2286 /DNA_END=5966 /DNA_ORIENTATION=+